MKRLISALALITVLCVLAIASYYTAFAESQSTQIESITLTAEKSNSGKTVFPVQIVRDTE